MTALTKPVRREVATVRRDRGKLRPLCVTLHAGFLEIRLKGTRHCVAVGYEAVLDMGYRALARAKAEEKRQQRKAGRP